MSTISQATDQGHKVAQPTACHSLGVLLLLLVRLAGGDQPSVDGAGLHGRQQVQQENAAERDDGQR